MKNIFKLLCFFAPILMAVTFACSKKEDSAEDPQDDNSKGEITEEVGTLAVEVPVNVTEVSLASLPTINKAGVANPGTLAAGSSLKRLGGYNLQEVDDAPVVGDPVKNQGLQQIFALECYWDINKDNWCPDAITEGLKDGTIPAYGGPDSTTEAPYWFSNFSILGIIHHAEAYFNESYSYAKSATKIKPETISYKATQDYDGNPIENGDPAKFIVDIPNIYNRYHKGSGESLGMHFLFNGDAKTDGRYSAIPWAKFIGGNSTRNTGGAQSYMTIGEDGKAPHVYVVNQIMSYTDQAGEGFRMILMMNYVTNHFLFVQGSANSAGRDGMVVAGKGGFDNATSAWKEGAYYAQKFINNSITWESCVDNKTQTIIGLDASHADCAFVKPFFDKDDSFDPAAHLGLTDLEKSDLVNFLAYFKNAIEFENSVVPGGKEDAQNFPDEVSFEEVEAVE